MERKLAEQIVALVNGCIDQLIASLAPVEEHASPEEFAAYKRGVARVINAFDVEIIDRVAREHPDLRPEDDASESPEAEPFRHVIAELNRDACRSTRRSMRRWVRPHDLRFEIVIARPRDLHVHELAHREFAALHDLHHAVDLRRVAFAARDRGIPSSESTSTFMRRPTFAASFAALMPADFCMKRARRSS